MIEPIPREWAVVPHPFLRRWRMYAAIVKRFLAARLDRAPFHRSGAVVRERYATVWRESPAAVRRTAPATTLREYRGEIYRVPKIDMRKIHLGEMSRALAGFGAVSSVLELGSGNGINVFALAALHPGIKTWRGVELTPEGIAAAERSRREPPLGDLARLTGLPADTIRERLGAADIAFRQGSILDLPFPDRSADIAFSRFVLEQLPCDYPVAFREARRVARVGGFFLEEFREAQVSAFQVMQLSNLDYFRASCREVERFGWKIKSFERSAMNKVEFSFGLLACV